jgi:YidC/Oxa1 family membrane protein insertase
VVHSWTLKKYSDRAGKPLELVNAAAAAKTGWPFSLDVKQQPTTDPDKALFRATPDPDELGISFEFSDGRSVFHKSFRFAKNSYLWQIASDAKINGVPAANLLVWRGGFGDQTIPNAATVEKSVYYDLSNTKLVTKSAKDAKKGPVSDTGDYSFAGIEDTYFAAVLLPREEGRTELDTFSDTITNPATKKDEPRVGVAAGGAAENRYQAYVGPKDVDILNAVDPRLKQLIDWGWFGVIAKPLFYCLKWIYSSVAHNYGWSIILLTVTINLVLLPLRYTSLKSSRKMQALQPHIKAINEKYKNISMRDPRKAEQNTEVMDLYKKHGVNPVGGCLPMILQLPILYAIYRVLTVAIELRGAHWLWVTDLSQPENLPIRILPTVMVVTQFVLQRMTPNPSTDPSQQKMMMFMPLAFGFFFYYYPSGLVLYWLTGNLVGILQQWAINRLSPAPTPIEPPKPAVRKKGRS